jgi:cytochrome b6-f complex iron-sulfur subunit
VRLLAISSGTVAALIVLAAANVFAIVFGLSFLRANRAARAREAGLAEAPTPAKAVSRRDFFRRSLIGSLLVFGAQFGGGTIAFLWPNLKGGFGSVINAGKLEDILAEARGSGEPVYNGNGRFYIVPYDGNPMPDADYVAAGVAVEGIMPLYQRCVHLGCRVPFCSSSKWFECPCHGSKYNGAGEYRLGPAPRGMDRFKIQIDPDGNVLVDTSAVELGPPRGIETLGQPTPLGPYCVAPG